MGACGCCWKMLTFTLNIFGLNVSYVYIYTPKYTSVKDKQYSKY